MYTSSSKDAKRKAEGTSICSKQWPHFADSDSSKRKVLKLPVLAYTSKKSTPYFCMNPFGVNRALKEAISPCSSVLILNTHFTFSTLVLLGTLERGTYSHTF